MIIPYLLVCQERLKYRWETEVYLCMFSSANSCGWRLFIHILLITSKVYYWIIVKEKKKNCLYDAIWYCICQSFLNKWAFFQKPRKFLRFVLGDTRPLDTDHVRWNRKTAALAFAHADGVYFQRCSQPATARRGWDRADWRDDWVFQVDFTGTCFIYRESVHV